MIASMYSLDHRLAELRSSERDQLLARERRARGAVPPSRVGRSAAAGVLEWLRAGAVRRNAGRVAAG